MTDKSLEQTEFEGEQTLDPVAGNSFYNDEEKDSAVYPDAQVNIVAENASVFQLKRKFDKEPPLLKLDPDFQRHEVWGPRRPINMALFESISYLLILLENYLPKMKDELSRSYNNLINDEKFINSLTYTVDSNSSVAARFSLVEQEADTIKLLS